MPIIDPPATAGGTDFTATNHELSQGVALGFYIARRWRSVEGLA